MKQILLILGLLYSVQAFSQTFFQKLIIGTGDETPYDFIPLEGGNYLMIGSTIIDGNEEATITKLDNEGNVLWYKMLSGAGNDRLIIGEDYFLVGSSEACSGINKDGFIVKMSTDGNVEWSKSYDILGDDVFRAMTKTNDGGAVVVGFSNSFNNPLMMKIDATGVVEWLHSFDSVSSFWATSIIEVEGGYIVGGSKNQGGAGAHDAMLMKADNQGNLQWAKTYGGTDNDSYDFLTVDNNGNIFCGGNAWSWNTEFTYDAYLNKIDSDGNLIWSKRMTEAGKSLRTRSFDILENGDIIVELQRPDSEADEKEFSMVGLSGDGTLLWSRQYQEGFTSTLQDVVIEDDTKLWAIGHATGGTDQDFMLLKTDIDGLIETCPSTQATITITDAPTQTNNFIPSEDSNTTEGILCNLVVSDVLFTENTSCSYTVETSIENVSAITAIKLYPVPTAEKLQVEFNTNTGLALTLELVNINGSILTQKKLKTNQGNNIETFDVATLSSGIYFLKITDGNSIWSERFVKE